MHHFIQNLYVSMIPNNVVKLIHLVVMFNKHNNTRNDTTYHNNPPSSPDHLQ